MPDSASKKKWDKENVVLVTAKLFRSTDSEVIEFLDGKPASTVIKVALREYVKNHKGEEFILPEKKAPEKKVPELSYYVIGGQHEPVCYGGAATLQAAKKIASKNDELWDMRQGWHRPSVFAAEDTIEIVGENLNGECQREVKPNAEPVSWWDGKRWNDKN